MNNDTIFFCLSKFIISYSFNLKVFGCNSQDKDKPRLHTEAYEAAKKWKGRRGNSQEQYETN